MYVQRTYKYMNSWTCMYILHTKYKFMYMYITCTYMFMNCKHVYTCLYRVQRRTYRFVQSSSYGQDSRCNRTQMKMLSLVLNEMFTFGIESESAIVGRTLERSSVPKSAFQLPKTKKQIKILFAAICHWCCFYKIPNTIAKCLRRCSAPGTCLPCKLRKFRKFRQFQKIPCLYI